MKYVLFVNFDTPAEVLLPNAPKKVGQRISQEASPRCQHLGAHV